MLVTGTRRLRPAAKQQDVGARNVHAVAETVLWRCATDSQAGPDISLGVEHTDIVEVAFLKGAALSLATSFLHVIVIEPEATMHDEVGSDQDGAVALARTGRGASRLGLGPSHDFEVKHVDIVEEVATIPAAKDDHLSASHQIGRVVEASRRGATALRTLIPRHGNGVERMQVTADVFLALASEDDDSRSGEDGRVPIATGRRRSRDLRLNPAGGVNIEHVGVVEVLEAGLLTLVEVSAEDHQRSTGERCRVPASGRWWNALDLGEGPEPLSLD